MKTAIANAVNTKKVLVIDDEPIIREVIQTCLEDLAGWDVRTARSGWDAMNKMTEERPDAIILDVIMPGMDGLTFIRKLRANQEIRSIPIFLLTSRAEYTDQKHISDLDLAGALTKPFDAYELVEQIATAFGWELEN